MKASEFCYWLQGYFEISNSNYVTQKQATIIAKHLDLVTTYESENGRDSCSDFIDYLHGQLKNSLSYDLSQSKVQDIKYMLGEVFQHHIDVSYGNPNGLQEKLNKIHMTIKDPDAPVYRC